VQTPTPSVQVSSTAPTEPPKKKGSFWKKLGTGLSVGAAVAATAYGAAYSGERQRGHYDSNDGLCAAGEPLPPGDTRDSV